MWRDPCSRRCESEDAVVRGISGAIINQDRLNVQVLTEVIQGFEAFHELGARIVAGNNHAYRWMHGSALPDQQLVNRLATQHFAECVLRFYSWHQRCVLELLRHNRIPLLRLLRERDSTRRVLPV